VPDHDGGNRLLYNEIASFSASQSFGDPKITAANRRRDCAEIATTRRLLLCGATRAREFLIILGGYEMKNGVHAESWYWASQGPPPSSDVKRRIAG